MTRTATPAGKDAVSEVSRRSGRSPLIAGGAVLVAALAAAIFAAKPGGQNAAPAAAAAPAPIAATEMVRSFEPSERHFDFGSISMAAGKVSHRFWFRNEGVQPVLLERIHTSCMCTTATLVKGMRIVGTYGMAGHGPLPDVNQTLAPGEAAYIDAVFDPAAHGPAGLGRTERIITLERAGGLPLQLSFSANVRP